MLLHCPLRHVCPNIKGKNTPDLDDNDDVFIFLGLNINPI